jgi:hypothetical protein
MWRGGEGATLLPSIEGANQFLTRAVVLSEGFAAAMPTYFIAGVLYLLHLERVDNLGTHSIPSETGLLIPSVYVKLGKCNRWRNILITPITAI